MKDRKNILDVSDLVTTLMYHNNIPFDWDVVDKMTEEVEKALPQYRK